MTTNERIIEILRELQIFFSEHEIWGWTNRTEDIINEIGKPDNNTRSILDSYIGRGMGSLPDLYICEDNGHILHDTVEATNKRLERMIERLLTMKQALHRSSQ